MNTKGGLGFNRPKLPEIEKRRDEIAKKLEFTMNDAEKKAMMESRKKKLLEQRMKLLQKKKAERADNLKKYEQIEGHHLNKASGGTEKQGLSDATLKKRNEIYAMLKR